MKYGILGVGQVGLRHAEAFSKIKNLKLVGFVEKNVKKINFFCKVYNTKSYKNLKDLINQKPDFIIICLPHNQRVSPIIECIKNNINLLIEKPLCFNNVEIKILLPFLKKRKIKISISFVHRYRKELMQAYELINKNRIGSIKVMSVNMHSYKNPILPSWIDNLKISGGGVLMYNAIHSIDNLLYLANSKVVNVTAKKNNINKNLKVEDNINVIIQFKNGIIGSLFSTFTPYKIHPVWQTQIYGDKGMININTRKNLSITQNLKVKTFDYLNYYKTNGANFNFYLQAVSFINSLKKNKKTFINENDGIKSILVVDAIYKSIKLGKTIKLN